MPAATTSFSSAGTKLNVVATAPATYDATGYAALTWTAGDVGEVVNMGEFGSQYSLITQELLNSRIVKKFKGNVNYGSLQLELGRAPGDEGQIVLLAALASDNSYSFMVTLQDGTKQYFTGKVMSYTTNVGTSNQITAAACLVEIDRPIVEVAPT